MAATVMPPRPLTPQEAMRARTREIDDIVDRLVRALEAEQRKNITLGTQLADALDRVFELESELSIARSRDR